MVIMLTEFVYYIHALLVNILITFPFKASTTDMIIREISDEMKAVKLIAPSPIPIHPPIKNIMVTRDVYDI